MSWQESWCAYKKSDPEGSWKERRLVGMDYAVGLAGR